ncbi:PH domain-containing protein [Staphylococcus petrasii]|uniref:PH domain-containing protein n=1 Tax=Staphylococcus petrasii TaxID=1276936 RepID=UPI003F66437F
MNDYKYMHKNGPKVMRLVALIIFIVFLIIVSVVTYLDIAYMHLMSPVWTIVLAIGVLIIFVICFVFGAPFLKYKNFRYYYNDNEIYIRKGVIFIQTTIIPFYRIQNIDIEEGYFMRQYNLASLHLSTAGGDAEIELINKEEASKLKEILQFKKANESEELEELDEEI